MLHKAPKPHSWTKEVPPKRERSEGRRKRLGRGKEEGTEWVTQKVRFMRRGKEQGKNKQGKQ